MGSIKYFCPMKCEGDRVYDGPGVCPLCNMFLVPVDTVMGKGNDKVSNDHISNQRQDYQHKTSKGNRYYCPMQCEGDKVYFQPGNCPVCGMHLVSQKGIKTSEEEKAYKKMTQKFWIALVLSFPVFMIAMSEHFLFLHSVSISHKKILNWLS